MTAMDPRGSQSEAPIRRLESGTVFGRYVIERELGAGGQGAVFLAQDRQLHRRVALKVLHRHAWLGEQSGERLQREAQLAARIDHPSACEVYDSGVLDGQPYLAMRYVEGAPMTALRELVPAEDSAMRTEAARRLRWIEQAAQALHRAHQLGILHRDIKPGNLMVTADDRAVVLDFGLAKDLSAAARSGTAESVLCGTPAYMSPEQLTLDAPPLDGRTDIYSLGLTLFELIAGHAAFGRTELFPTLASRQRLPDLRVVQRRWNRDLRAVLERALAVDRAERYDTAQAFAEDVRRCREGYPVAARPACMPLRLKRWVWRNPLLAGATAALLLSLVVGTALSLRFAFAAFAARDTSEWRRYAAHLVLASQLIGDSQREGALATLDECDPGLRGYEWRLVRSRADDSRDVGSLGGDAVVHLRRGAGGGVMAIDAAGACYDVDAARPRAAVARPGCRGTVMACDARDGTRVVALDAEPRSKLQIESAQGVYELDCPVERPLHIAIAPGAAAACVVDYDTVWGVSLAERRVLERSIRRGATPRVQFAATPQGLRLCVAFNFEGERRAVLQVYAWPSLARVLEIEPPTGRCDAFAVSADGLRVVVATSGLHSDHRAGAVLGYDLATGDELGRYAGQLGRCAGLVIDPEDRWVAFAERSGVVRILDGALSVERRRMLGHRGEVRALCAADSSTLLTGNELGEVRRFHLPAARMEALARYPLRGVTALAFGPDDRTLLAGSQIGVRNYDLTGRRGPQQTYGIAAALGCGSGRVWTAPLRQGAPIIEHDFSAGEVQPVLSDPADAWVRGAWLDPDAQRAVVVTLSDWADRDGASRLLELRAGERQERQRRELGVVASGPPSLQAAPDGRRLALAIGASLSVWDLEEGKRLAHREMPGPIRYVSWGTDDLIAAGESDGRLWFTDAALSAITEVSLPTPLRALACHPELPRVVVGCRGGFLGICSLDPAQHIVALPRFGSEIQQLQFDGSGDRLAVGFVDSHVEVLDCGERGRPTVITKLAPAALDAEPLAERFARRLASGRRMYGFDRTRALGLPQLTNDPWLPPLWYEVFERAARVNSYGVPARELLATRAMAHLRLGQPRQARDLLAEVEADLRARDRVEASVVARLALAEALCGDGARAAERFAGLVTNAYDGARQRATATRPETGIVTAGPAGIEAWWWLQERSGRDVTAVARELERLSEPLRTRVRDLWSLRVARPAVQRMFAWLTVSTPDLDRVDYEAARRWAVDADAVDTDEARPELRAAALVRLGRGREALQILGALPPLPPARSVVRRMFTALAHAAGGDRDAAQRAYSRFVFELGAAAVADGERRDAMREEVRAAVYR
ncbi:MAG: WD40 repeat domain-containing serine/threonine protein kinase [Planctomycetota bacterium]